MSQALYFLSPGEVCVQEEDLPEPLDDQLLVHTLLSAISPGTEMLVYRGEFPSEMELDENIPALTGRFAYPLKYGYSLVGEVVKTGRAVGPGWLGKRVFSFHPHESAFLARPAEVIPVPQGLDNEDAVFLANMETAVSLVLDGAPLIGEQVAVFGQGIVGLLTTTLLAQFPLASLVTFDWFPLRRQASLEAGAQACLDPTASRWLAEVQTRLPGGADLVFELSGSPAALDLALATARFSGRVVIGSWYGKKRASVDLGSRFHRSRIRLVSSQVSTIAPELSGRWTKARRLAAAWDLLHQLKPSKFITHRFPITEAEHAYRLLANSPEEAIQVVLTYSE